jgi:catechol 2,3-dioxygenase-like lactoylglutathione lyase family enzyme
VDTPRSARPPSDTPSSDRPPSDPPPAVATAAGTTSPEGTSTPARPDAVAASPAAEGAAPADGNGGTTGPGDGKPATPATDAPTDGAVADPEPADAPGSKGSTAAKAAGIGLVAAGLAAAGLAAVGKKADRADAHADADADADAGTVHTADPGDAGDRTNGGLDELVTAYPSARPGPAGAIHGIGMTVLVTDLDRSRRFYRDLLGFHEIDSGRDSAVLASGDTRLVLRTVTEVAAVRARPVHLNLEVGDVHAMHAELAGRGARFTHAPRVVNRGQKLELLAASLDDPDGHGVDISQWRAVMD